MDQIVGILIITTYILTFLLPVNVYAYLRAKKEREATKRLVMSYWRIYGGKRK